MLESVLGRPALEALITGFSIGPCSDSGGACSMSPYFVPWYIAGMYWGWGPWYGL